MDNCFKSEDMEAIKKAIVWLEDSNSSTSTLLQSVQGQLMHITNELNILKKRINRMDCQLNELWLSKPREKVIINDTY